MPGFSIIIELNNILFKRTFLGKKEIILHIQNSDMMKNYISNFNSQSAADKALLQMLPTISVIFLGSVD